MALPEMYIEAILPFLDHPITEDDLHDMISLCYATSSRSKFRFINKATKSIQQFFSERRQERNTLYNPYRNISLNQCIGDSNSPVSDWLNVSDWREWD